MPFKVKVFYRIVPSICSLFSKKFLQPLKAFILRKFSLISKLSTSSELSIDLVTPWIFNDELVFITK